MTHLRHLIGLLFAALITAQGWAQTPEELAKLDPAELYFQAWSLVKEAEELEEKEDYVKAFTQYRKARSFFDIIKLTRPDFRQESVKGRADSTTQAMEKIHEKALTQQKTEQDAGATPLLEIPGQARPSLKVPSAIDPTGQDSRKIQDLQNTITGLKNTLNQKANQRDSDSARLRQQIRDQEAELSRLAASPLRDQVQELNRQIDQLRRERDAMAHARDQAVTEQARTLRRLETAQRTLAGANSEIARLEAIVAKQTTINGRVVEGQQDQIDALRNVIKTKDAMIAEVNSTVKSLAQQLKQSQTMVEELRVERDTLIDERDQMKALLKMNEADRVQQLITQNVSLSKELNEAKANLELVETDTNSKKEVILLAKQRLVVAKAKIENLQKANSKANLRMDRLEERLKQAEADLLAQLNGGELNQRAKEEIAMLRGVVDKQKAKLAAQIGAASLLLEQGERKAETDAHYQDAMARINGDKKMELTIPEMELLERTAANPSFTNNDRPTPQELNRATSDLRQMTKDLNQVARRLFTKGDFLAARGTLQLIVGEDPGAWEAMVNLGIVHLRLKDYTAAARQFSQSILVAGDRKIPYAHFMLGDSLYRRGRYDDAADELRRSLSLQPQNAQAHILLGNISGKTNDFTDAEFHFKEALSQNPALYEPHFNLSILAITAGRKDEAQKYYRDYLRKGGPASAEQEERLRLQ